MNAMDQRRKARREAREREVIDRPKIQQQFTDFKRGLSSECDSIPTVENMTRSNKRKKGNEAAAMTWAVPDTVLVVDRSKTEYVSSLEMSGVETSAGTLDSGTLTNFVEIRQARDKILSLKLGQVRSILARLFDAPVNSVLSALFFRRHTLQLLMEEEDQVATPDTINRLVGIFKIPQKPGIGISNCQFQVPPLESPSTRSAFTSTQTPRGFVAYPRMAGLGARIQGVHWYCRKVWVYGPPVEKNLALLNQMDPFSSKLADIQALFARLELPKITILDSREIQFEIQANVLYSSFSFTTCCHAEAVAYTGADMRGLEGWIEWRPSSAAKSHFAKDVDAWNHLSKEGVAGQKHIFQRVLNQIKISRK